MEDIKQYFYSIQKKEFKSRDGKRLFTDKNKIKKDKRYKKTKKWLKDRYERDGMGIKAIIKDYELPITYSVLRHIFKFFDIKIRDSGIVTDFIRKRRSRIAKLFRSEGIGFGSIESIQKTKIISSTKRGIQGYYWNKSKNKWVWLRSSWEYIYAKWLDSNNIDWDVEVKIFYLSNKETYRPDFFIYDDFKNLKTIVEIKGYWKDKIWKIDELKKELEADKIEVCVITDITPYSKNLKKDRILWKNIRKKELK